jgi:hypothetical protein
VRVREGTASEVRTFKVGFFMMLFDELFLLFVLFSNGIKSVAIIAWEGMDRTYIDVARSWNGRLSIRCVHICGPAARHGGKGVLRRPDCLWKRHIGEKLSKRSKRVVTSLFSVLIPRRN